MKKELSNKPRHRTGDHVIVEPNRTGSLSMIHLHFNFNPASVWRIRVWFGKAWAL